MRKANHKLDELDIEDAFSPACPTLFRDPLFEPIEDWGKLRALSLQPGSRGWNFVSYAQFRHPIVDPSSGVVDSTNLVTPEYLTHTTRRGIY